MTATSAIAPAGNPKLGFLLALTTAFMWGAVPVAMTPLVADVSPMTISWVRMTTAGLVLMAMFQATGRLRRMPLPIGREIGVLVLAVVMLTGNFVLYVWSLSFIAAPVAQCIVQIAPVLLMIGSMWVYGERFSRAQWLGFVVLLVGIGAFCLERLRATGADADIFSTGVLVMLVAAICWTVYGLAQKRLLIRMRSQQILMMIYLGCATLLFPVSELDALSTLSGLQLSMLIFLSLNTLIGYGAFAEALSQWEASKVSAVLAFQPVVTLFGAVLLGVLFPTHWPAEPLTLAAVLSSLVVVAGSMACALGAKWRLR